MGRPANQSQPANHAPMMIANAVAKEKAGDVEMNLAKEQNNLAKMAKIADVAAAVTTPSRVTRKLRLQSHFSDVLLVAMEEAVESPVSLLLMVSVSLDKPVSLLLMVSVSLDKPVSQETE